MPVGAQNDTDPIWRQCNLESLEENIILKFLSCALRQDFVTSSSVSPPMQASPSVSAFPNGEWIALGCGRARIVAKIIRKKFVGTRHAEAQP
jgi:hypothetical protein